jgi:tRNA G18 (ribose-2'-O)-methylase SpoU
VPVLAVADAADSRLADYRGVPDPELARRRGVFVAEGRLVVRRLLASRVVTRSVMVTPTAFDGLTEEIARRPELPVFVVPQAVMDGVAGFNIHRGCLAIGERPAAAPWDAITRECPSAPAAPRAVIALERVGNADNVGAVFRAAAAFGAGGVLLDPACADPLYRKAIRTSMGAALDVPFAAGVPLLDAIGALRADGWDVIGLTPAATALPVRDTVARASTARVLLVLGHEGDGLTGSTAAACSHLARIPMRGGVDSLNVAMAAGVALYEWAQSTGRS